MDWYYAGCDDVSKDARAMVKMRKESIAICLHLYVGGLVMTVTM